MADEEASLNDSLAEIDTDEENQATNPNSSSALEAPPLPRAQASVPDQADSDALLKRGGRPKDDNNENDQDENGQTDENEKGSSRRRRGERRNPRRRSSRNNRDEKAGFQPTNMQEDIRLARASRQTQRQRDMSSSSFGSGLGGSTVGGDSTFGGSTSTQTKLSTATRRVTNPEKDTGDGPSEADGAGVGAYQVTRRAPGQLPQWARAQVMDAQRRRMEEAMAHLHPTQPESQGPDGEEAVIEDEFYDDRIISIAELEDADYMDAPVYDVAESPQLLSSHEDDDLEGHGKLERRQQVGLVCVVIALLAIIVAVTISGIAGRGNSDGVEDLSQIRYGHCDPNGTVVDSIERSGTYVSYRALLESKLEDPQALDVACSSYDLALTWLSITSPDLTPSQIDQRYAMALFYFLGNMKETFLSVSNPETNPWVVADPEECTWFGITCDADDQLVSIELRSVLITGPIPTDWGILLPHLRTLEVIETAMNGALPLFLYSSPTLVTLNLQSNKLSGPIDKAEWSAVNLEKLILGGNDLSGTLPASIGSLPNLEKIELSDNEFTGILPDTIMNGTSLKTFDLSRLRLSGTLPQSMSSQLESIFMEENNFVGEIPSVIYSLTNLYEISLFGNRLTGTLSDAIGGLTNLEYLNVELNSLTGTLPSALASLTKLKQLILGFNDFSGAIFSGIGNLVNLEHLVLNNNDLIGNLIPELGNLTLITELRMDSNDFTGSIPSSLANLKTFVSINLVGNDLDSFFPMEICQMLNARGVNARDVFLYVDVKVDCDCCSSL
mmetsp:Transcript_22008/g.39690  ORF Transcript_22008/g.39690 Transcript_22008/m.39690 type:complete len:783 (-) Transcript_22008:323-2671(-)